MKVKPFLYILVLLVIQRTSGFALPTARSFASTTHTRYTSTQVFLQQKDALATNDHTSATATNYRYAIETPPLGKFLSRGLLSIVLSLILLTPNAEAIVSSGRMGGSFSRSSSTRVSSPSRSYSSPSRSYSSPSRSYSSPSRSYSSPSRRNYSSPTKSTPSRTVSSPRRSYSSPSRYSSTRPSPSRSKYSSPRPRPSPRRSSSSPTSRSRSSSSSYSSSRPSPSRRRRRSYSSVPPTPTVIVTPSPAPLVVYPSPVIINPTPIIVSPSPAPLVLSSPTGIITTPTPITAMPTPASSVGVISSPIPPSTQIIDSPAKPEQKQSSSHDINVPSKEPKAWPSKNVQTLCAVTFVPTALVAIGLNEKRRRSLLSNTYKRKKQVSPRNNQMPDVSTSALGAGTTVARITVALNVPDRDDSDSLLAVLDRLSMTAKTDTRKGVQSLTNQVVMNILRRKYSIHSAACRYQHFKNEQKAAITFQRWSVEERSKFEKENVSNYNGIDLPSLSRQSRLVRFLNGGKREDNKKPTMVVVMIALSIQGDSTKLSKVNSLQDVIDNLQLIATHSMVEDCLNGAEILWAPEDRNEVVSMEDIVADFPDLTTV